MQPERVRRYSNPLFFSNDLVERGRERDSMMSTGFLSAAPLPPSNARLNYIEHPVSKMDTLAGVAIKYGVEVADIKRMNGLVTDLQMFALRSLQIPLPGRHPPSSAVGNGSAGMGESSNGNTETRQPHMDVFDSFQPLKLKPPQRRVSSAMSTLQGYYGLTPPKSKNQAEGTEMAVYRMGTGKHQDAETLQKTTPVSEPSPTRHRKSLSLANGFLLENGELLESLLSDVGDGELEKSNDSVRRRQKADTDVSSPTPETILKEDNSSGGLSGRAGKGLALRPKSGSRFTLPAEAETAPLNLIPFGDSASVADGFASFRKSSSTSNLQSSDNGNGSLWPTSKWSLRSDLQALSTAAITRPIFDGLPKPVTSRRNKAALD
ncbi:hypothetical protein H6P81_017791 [Aristolochia fimbriata]|uniref:LysM domain-containing protein n=1 Tax=Aristolochia fimbriata TaxID=158543 RepID=A0AAV7DZN1_ARIFI|nr:hypothetical protein H6P81_017791 [Aristolochia fimbriata]